LGKGSDVSDVFPGAGRPRREASGPPRPQQSWYTAAVYRSWVRAIKSYMCRLFGMLSPEPVTARFWLLDAPDSVLDQSLRNPDGTGLAHYVGPEPVVDKQPIAAYEDRQFAAEAAMSTPTCSSPTSATPPGASLGQRTPSPSPTAPSSSPTTAPSRVWKNLPGLWASF
jgi:hypothetical protein